MATLTRKQDAEREIKRLASTFLDQPTTTKEGMRQYKRVERRVHKLVGEKGKISRWNRIRENIRANMRLLDEELNEELFVFGRKKKRD